MTMLRLYSSAAQAGTRNNVGRSCFDDSRVSFFISSRKKRENGNHSCLKMNQNPFPGNCITKKIFFLSAG
jgi:hypothetical protein